MSSVLNNSTFGLATKSALASREQTTTQTLLAMPDGIPIRDVVIIGAGPAALTAAIYTARDNLDTLVLEKAVIGGMPATIDLIANYPGFPDGISGMDFAEKLQTQAEKFGAKIESVEVLGLKSVKNGIKLTTTDGDVYTKTVIIASGSDHKKANVPGEKKYFSKGVHYCATCDGAFYKDKKLVVVGGGNSAVQQSLFLTRYAKHIDLLVRSSIRASDVLVQQLGENKQITVHLHTVLDEIVGDENTVKYIKVTHTQDGKKQELKTDGLFVFIGQQPNTGFLVGSGVVLDEAGFIQTDHKLMTNVKGIFAAGDVRSGATMQITCATGDGTMAAFSVREYLQHKPKLDYKNIEA